MPRAKKPPLTLAERLAKLNKAQISDNKPAGGSEKLYYELEDIKVRIKRILGLTEKHKKSKGRMLFFVMYDIESDKVRRLISKYLQDKGCSRVQHSVFLAEASLETYNKIKHDLEEVQSSYDNNDSILVLPISTDYLNMMKIIGQQISVDIITHSKNTIFF